MRKIILFIFQVFLVIGYASSQSDNLAKNQIPALFDLLSDKTHTVDIMDGIETNPRQLSLLMKFQLGIQLNNEWYLEYLKTSKPGKGLNYHPNFGMSEDEFIELGKLSKQIGVYSTGQEQLQIIKFDTIITFSTSGRLSPLNQVKVNLAKNQVHYKNYILPFVNKVNVLDEDNAFKSKWKGYNWVFEIPDDFEDTYSNKRENLNLMSIKFTIGVLDKNGKVYIQLKEQKVENGEKTIDVDIPILF